MLTIQTNAALLVITSRDGLAKIIWDTNVTPEADDLFEDIRWKYHIDDLKDPTAYRKVRRSQFKEPNTVKLVWDFEKNEAVVKQPKAVDYAPANGYSHTLKTAVSLLPATGRMSLYPEKNATLAGLLYDIKECDLRGGRYVFAADASTSEPWWKIGDASGAAVEKPSFFDNPKGDLAFRAKENATNFGRIAPSADKKQELANIKAKLSAQAGYNEILAGVSKGAVRAVIWSPADQSEEGRLAARLIALSRRAYAANRLDVILPVFEVSDKADPVAYDPQQWEMDQQAVAENDGLVEKLAKRLWHAPKGVAEARKAVQTRMAGWPGVAA